MIKTKTIRRQRANNSGNLRFPEPLPYSGQTYEGEGFDYNS
jgi:hypothetical protein